jgi:tyrosine-protein phosphatase non-receptor type 1
MPTVLWQVYFFLFQQIRRESMNHDHTTIEASKPENRSLNRYRDVYPYDHSRVDLWDCEDTDYINASLVEVKIHFQD